jgi:acyl-[acyl carrier protein]--UDP-N-acetylglucosamine O-acyltransferase
MATIFNNTHIHPAAVIDKRAVVHSDAIIGAFALIFDDAEINADAVIHEYAVIGRCAIIGNRATIGARAIVRAGVTIYADAEIRERAIICEYAEIGAQRKDVHDVYCFLGYGTYKRCTSYRCDDGVIVTIGCANDHRGATIDEMRQIIAKKYNAEHNYYKLMDFIENLYK